MQGCLIEPEKACRLTTEKHCWAAKRDMVATAVLIRRNETHCLPAHQNCDCIIKYCPPANQTCYTVAHGCISKHNVRCEMRPGSGGSVVLLDQWKRRCWRKVDWPCVARFPKRVGLEQRKDSKRTRRFQSNWHASLNAALSNTRAFLPRLRTSEEDRSNSGSSNLDNPSMVSSRSWNLSSSPLGIIAGLWCNCLPFLGPQSSVAVTCTFLCTLKTWDERMARDVVQNM